MSGVQDDFKIVSLNVNGLNDTRKQRLVFKSLKKHKQTLFLLQETHCRPGNGRLWKSQWGSTLFLTETSGNAGGVATLFSADLDPLCTRVTTSSHNRFIITDFVLGGEKYRVVNIYMPTADKEILQIEVLEELALCLKDDEGEILIVAGDFNVALNAQLDRVGYTQDEITNRNFRGSLLDFLHHFDLQDIWRIQNSKKSDFTWSRGGKFARLDYMFPPEAFPGKIKALQPVTYPFSDHRMIGIKLRPVTSPRGRGFWKLQASLLDRNDLCEEILRAIREGEKDSEGLQPDVRWDYIKLCIRDSYIKFLKKLREEAGAMERELEARILELENGLLSSSDFQEEYHLLKRELYQVPAACTNTGIYD